MNKIYNTLYSKDSTGNIREWFMEQQGDKYRTHSGVQGGSIVVSEWTTAEPKNVGKLNATNGISQATSEILNKYKKQLKTGYSETLAGVETNAYESPMLAKSYKDHKESVDFISRTWGLQCKLNGGRCKATKDGLWSRKGERIVATPHIEKSLKSFFDKYPNAVLDGELFNWSLRQSLNELMKLVRKTKPTTEDFVKSEKIVEYHIYDGFNFDVGFEQYAPYGRRKRWIDSNIVKGQYPYLKYVHTIVLESEKQFEEEYGKFIEDAQEGGILRKLDSPYQFKRSKFLLKHKPVDDAEGVILDINEGLGNWSGTGKVITLKWKDKVFNATFKGTHDQCVQFLKDKNVWIGKEVKFQYSNLTGLGIPNYARMDIDNCDPRK